MGVCYLHIGPHKAASTYLQKSISRNRDLLESEKISVPWMKNDGPTQVHHNLAFELSKNWRFRKKDKTFKDLEKFLIDHEPNNILITSENLENISQDKEMIGYLGDFFSRLGYEVRVLVVVRPQTGLINSGYTEQIRRLLHRMTFAEAVEAALNHWKQKYDMNVNFKYWMEYFDCQFIPLNGDVMTKGLDRIFFQKLGLAERTLVQLRGGEAANEAPGPKTVEAARTIRSILEHLAGPDLKAKNVAGELEVRRSLMRHSTKLGWNETSFYGYDDKLFRRVDDHFRDANDRFSRRVFSRPWSEMFSERPKAQNVFHLNEATEGEKTQFRNVVKHILYSLYKS